MVSSSRAGSTTSTPQDRDKEAERGSGNRTDINLSLSASHVSEESSETTTEKLMGQCLQLPETQDETQDTSVGPFERPEASLLNDNGIYGAICDFSDEEAVGTVREATVSATGNQQLPQSVAQSKQTSEINKPTACKPELQASTTPSTLPDHPNSTTPALPEHVDRTSSPPPLAEAAEVARQRMPPPPN